jgi:pimeloyl-ACP methyl ester carboxylesterase
MSAEVRLDGLRDIDIDTPRGRFAALTNRAIVGAVAGDRGDAAQNHDPRPPLLALHGWLDNAASFLPMAPLLAHYHLVALDMPGHGQSFHYPDVAEYTPFSAILDISAAADALGWTRFAVLGHSMGGALSSFEALGPLAGQDEGSSQRLRDALSKRRSLHLSRKRVFSDIATGVQARMHTNVTTLDETSAQAIVQRGVRPVDGGYTWSSDARLTLPTAVRMTEGQIRDCLRAIECPVRIVMADPSPPYLPASLRDPRVACVRDVGCRILPGSHHLHMTHPRDVADALEL